MNMILTADCQFQNGLVSVDLVQEMPIKYSCCFCAACIGSLILSDLLAGLLYDMAAKEQGRWLVMVDIISYIC